MPAVPTPATLLERVRRDVERSAVRRRNGLRHLAGVGRPAVGCSAKEVVWERDKVKLYRYHSDRRRVRPPLLLVMSLISKPYVLDLRPGNSFVEALVARGFDVYMLDWGIPDAVESRNGFETYCDEYIPLACVVAMRESACEEISVFGYCFGGVLSLLFAAGHPEVPLRSLSVMATPIDFTVLGGAAALMRDGRLSPEMLVDETGNVPAAAVLRGMSMARVTGDLTTYASLLENLESSDYVAAHQALNGWATDHIPFPGTCLRQTVEWFMRDSRLAENRVVTGRGELDLGSIECPVMNVVGDADHLVPVESNRPIVGLIRRIDDIHFAAGHVGLIVGGRAQRVSVPAMADWIEEHGDTSS